MDVRGIPIDQVQIIMWSAIEAGFGINPGDYIKYGGTKISEVKPILIKFIELLEHLENAAVDGIISWDEIDNALVKLREIVAAAKALTGAPA